jgi:hypothetical protein
MVPGRNDKYKEFLVILSKENEMQEHYFIPTRIPSRETLLDQVEDLKKFPFIGEKHINLESGLSANTNAKYKRH